MKWARVLALVALATATLTTTTLTTTTLTTTTLTTTTPAEELLPESIAERPALTDAAGDGATAEEGGASFVGDGRASRQMEVSARQGVPGSGMDMFSMTLNALNPLPYLLGGLSGVRHVMQQRLQPLQAMITGNVPRPMNFKGNPAYLNSGGGGERHGGGGRLSGGAYRPFHSSHSTSESFKTVFKSTIRPSHDSISAPLKSHDFGTPKPISIVGDDRPETRQNNGDPHSPSPTPVDTFSPSNYSSTPGVFHSFVPQNKHTRIINIHVPEEMQNLTILEINMKSNGDISIGGGSAKHISSHQTNPPSFSSPPHLYRSPTPSPSLPSPPHPPPPHPPPLLSSPSPQDPLDPYPQYPTFPPGMGDIFTEDERLHEVPSETNIQGFDFQINPGEFSFDSANSPGLPTARPFTVNSLQDILRMQAMGNTNTALRYNIPVEWKPSDNLQPNLLNNNGFKTNEHTAVDLPQSLLRNRPIPYFSRSYPPEKSNSNNVYYVPVNVPSFSSQALSAVESRRAPGSQPQGAQPHALGAPVYYIDITVPGYRGVPIVNPQQYPRHKRSLQFDGWYPMDVSNPMADDPTVGYQPPPLEQVHFSNEPVPKKPMYPVRPENPTVFVVRAEPRHPEYHSVYGTENIEYFHIHPQTNIVRAFRAPSQSVGAIRFVPAPQFEHSNPSSISRPQTDTLQVSSQNPGNNVHLNTNVNYQNVQSKDSGFSDKFDTFDAYSNPRLPDESPRLDTNDNYDMEGAFSEIHSTTVERPSHVFPFSRRDRNSGSGKQQNAHSYRYRPDPPSRRLNQSRDQESKTSRPALHELLGNLPQESQIEEAPYLGSATDSAGASFVRKIPPPDFRYSSRGNIKQRQSVNSTRSHIRGTAQRQASTKSTQPFTRPWFLIDTRSETSERKREPSIASYIHPETHLGGEKVHYKPLGPVSYVSKEGDKVASDHIHNPHLDDHMNSYKPTLTANSLSELLQIFRFTQVTDGPDGEEATDEPVTVVREFRYTRPTEEPPPSSSTEPTTIQNIILTSFRYTPTTPSYNETTTEAEATEKPQGGDFDAVADTNSLDGYLFSDSEASPEYAHPQVRPNVVTTEGKDKVTAKGVTKATSRVSVQASTNSHVFEESSVTPETFKGLEIIYPGPSSKETTEASWPLYIIHQGHSKVRVFGINSAEDKSLGNPDYRELFVLSTLEPIPSSDAPLSSNATVDAPLATPPSSTSTSPTTTTINSTTFSSTTTSTTTSTTPSSTSSTTTSITNDPATTSASVTTDSTSSPFPVEETSTTPVTAEEDTTIPPSTLVTEQDLVPQNITPGENEYYYTDEEYDVPELTFGEDYQLEGDARPSLLLPNPSQTPLSEQSFSPPPLPVEEVPDALPSATTFSHVLRDRLPQLKHRMQQEESHVADTDASVPLVPAAGLTRAERSVARLVFFTKRLAEITEERVQLSQPFEYLSQLRSLQSDQRTPVSRSDDKPIPQPRTKRVTEAAPEA